LPETCTERNKYTKKNCAPSWLYLQDYTGMHGQKNIQNHSLVLGFIFHTKTIMIHKIKDTNY